MITVGAEKVKELCSCLNIILIVTKIDVVCNIFRIIRRCPPIPSSSSLKDSTKINWTSVTFVKTVRNFECAINFMLAIITRNCCVLPWLLVLDEFCGAPCYLR